MDLRLLEKEDIADAKALWKEAFGDSDRFIEWYFSNKVLPGNSLGIFDGGLVSVLHMVPFQIRVQGKILESAFIAGAATAKARQGQGLMRTLLLEALKVLKSRGIVMTHLYPFKHSFYENFGWATYSYVYEKNAKKQGGSRAGDIIETDDWLLLAPLYSGMMSRFDGYIVRNAREWDWRIKEYTADGGKAAALIKNGVPAAYIMYYDNGGKAEVIETVYNAEEDLQPLLDHVLINNRSAAYFTPAPGGRVAESYGTELHAVQYGTGQHGLAPYGTEWHAIPYGMARVVDTRALLGVFGAEEALEHIRITDDFAGWNNVGEGFKIDIGALAKIVHGRAEDIFGGAENNICIDILKKVFLPRVTCIFEQY